MHVRGRFSRWAARLISWASVDSPQAMKIVGNYRDAGYAHIEGLLPVEVTDACLKTFQSDLGLDTIAVSRISQHVNLLARPALDVYATHYPPMLFFLWGLTPIMSEITGCDLLPTYDYMRVYREGDVCRVHSDRFACEHSLSLTLDYSDGEVWDLQVGTDRLEAGSAKVDADFGGAPFASIPMRVGDAVAYQGVHHRHGRVTPNPNGWSAHIFLHWVDRNGPYAAHALEGHPRGKVNFAFA